MPLQPWWNRRRRLLLVLLGLLVCLGFGGRWAWVTHALTQARMSLELTRFREAQSWIDRAQRTDPGSVETALMQVRLERRRGDAKAFENALKRAAHLGAAKSDLRTEGWLLQAQQGDVKELQEHWLELIDYVDTSDLCESLVNGFLIRYRVAEADACITNWEKDAPRNPEPLVWKARLLRFDEKLDEVAIYLERALKLEPRHVVAAYLLGQVRFQQQRLDEALALYQRAAQGMEEPHPAWVREAETLRVMDRQQAAQAVMDRVLTHTDAAAVDQAWRLVGEPLGSGLVRAHLEKAQLEALAGRPAEAISWCRQVLKVDRGNIQAKVLLATALRRVGETGEADRLAAEIKATHESTVQADELRVKFRHHPNDPQIRFEMGKMIFEQVSEHTGVPWLESVLQFDPHHQETHRLLAEYYERKSAEFPEFAKLAQQHRQELRAP